MATVIWNPTDETFEAQYIGEHIEIEPDQKIRVDDNRGRALLNTLGPRGLVTLEYGDEGEKMEEKGRTARKRNFEFKKLQVIRYNQQNEAQHQQKLPYIPIPEQIQQYAKDVGIKLLEPYSFKDEEVSEIADLRKTKADQSRYIRQLEERGKRQDDQIADLAKKFDKLLTAMQLQQAQAPVEPSAEKKELDLQKIRDELGFKHVNRLHFKGWVARKWESIQAAPPEIQEEIQAKYIDLLNMPFPKEKPEPEEAAA